MHLAPIRSPSLRSPTAGVPVAEAVSGIGAAQSGVARGTDLPVLARGIADSADRLLDEACRTQRHGLLADLERIRGAGLGLARLLEGSGRSGTTDERLRHDLRTPLSIVKGFGELVLEEMETLGCGGMAEAMRRLLADGDELLAGIEAVITSDAPAPAPGDADAIADGLVDASRILIVDDTPANRELLARRLAREGYVAETAADGIAALERLAEAPFDLVLLDLIMPGADGFEVLQDLKRRPATRDVPVIMISALHDLGGIVRCIESGAEDYVATPFDPVLLRARIRAVLDRKRLRDRERVAVAQLRAEKERSEAMLLDMLPRSVVERLQSGAPEIADRFGEVSILFCDIVEFTALAARLPTARVLTLLDRVFTAFDDLAARHGLEKIKTIGDCYMLAAGLPEPRPDHAEAAAAIALAMLDEVAVLGAALGERLEVRIGIHSGAAIAGVLGRNKLVYDVWGDTVNTASRMESQGVPGRIHISAATYARLRHAFPCEPRGILDIRGKGPMPTWLLAGRRQA